MGVSSLVRVGSIGLRVKRVTGQKQVILSGLKRVRVNRVASRLGLGRVDPYFSHELKKKKNHVFAIWKVMQQIA